MINRFRSFLWFLSLIPLYAQADSLDIKIGQMLIVGMQGTSVNESSSIIQDIRSGIVGNVLLFEYNLNPTNTEKNLNILTQKLQAAAGIPLFISIDQEGGQVNRLKTKYGFEAMPSAKSVSDKKDTAYTRSIAHTIAKAIQRCGINLNFAPVVDVYNPLCPVLGKRNRCFSSDPDIITEMASVYIHEHHQAGIFTALKHFPGHGNSLSDSHLGLTDVSRVWKNEELDPYRNLIHDSLVDLIMSAHIINRKLDYDALPATLSKKIITDLLRGELNYQGVVVSDDMQMHAISSYYGLEESVRLAITAGVDMLIFSNNIKGASQYAPENIHRVIKTLVLNGSIPPARIDESFRRIMILKQKLSDRSK
ncbi:MAG: hypothetical protein JNJ58_08635 [Chitinophagaceae bacterium]|nr:hypothetical protein [Chitinophagaceae bacterium]